MTRLGEVEHTEYGDFVRVMPEIKRGVSRGYLIEYADMGSIHLVLRYLDGGEWKETGNVAQPIVKCLTSVRERREILKRRGRA